MEHSWLDTFQGQHVTVLSGPEDRSDTGTILRIADGWVQMIKDNGDMILVPYMAIRLIKLLDMTQAVPATERLSPSMLSNLANLPEPGTEPPR
ncbi:MAG TPA: hypothetical protein VFA07_01805 [Chthonomonadaceae bacterium]|nr:hypothetical protein [Chthonomonadaceae bacterium]